MYRIRCVLVVFKDLLAYKINILVFMLYGLLPLISAFLVSSNENLMMYYLMVFFVSQLVNGWTANQISGDIYSGKISQVLIFPRSFRFTYINARIAMLMFMFPTLLLVFILSIILGVEYSGLNIFFGFMSLILAVVIQFNVSVILGALAVWTTQSRGLITLWFSLLLPLSGVMFPLHHLPGLLYDVVLFTPFPYYIYIPTQTFLAKPEPILILAQVLMVSTTYLISKLVEVQSFKRFSAYGS